MYAYVGVCLAQLSCFFGRPGNEARRRVYFASGRRLIDPLFEGLAHVK